MELQPFLQRYFTAHGCVATAHKPGVTEVQLTEKMDRALMNRPFYWHYMKSTGMPGKPMKLTFLTSPDAKEEKGERIHFGSPRLLQIFTHLKENELYTRQFQVVDTAANVPLYPWLLINIKISYTGKHIREEIFSIGLQLVNGSMRTGMMGLLQDISLSSSITDFCYTISPVIKLESGFIRIEQLLTAYIENQDHRWSAQSIETMNEEIELVRHFFAGSDDVDAMQKEIAAIKERYHPNINLDVINGGLIYLQKDAI